MSPLDPAAVERELGELWKRLAGPEQGEGSPPLLRACVLNLIVYAPEGERAVDACIRVVTEEHPSRVLVLVPQPAGRRVEGGSRARVTAQCHPVGKGSQICCERITLESEESHLAYLPSLVRSLLVSDLPVVLWWRDRPLFGSRLFDELVETADRIVLDSGRGTSGLGALAELHQRLESLPDRAVTDLAWSRITSWRRAVAMLFDAADDRTQLDRITGVRIFTPPAGPSGGPGPEPFLLSGWLASRLGWQPLPAGSQPPGSPPGARERRLEFQGAARRITLTLEPEGKPDAGSAILGIRLETPDAAYAVDAESGGLLMLSPGALSSGGSRSPWSMPADSPEEGALIRRELSIAGHDRVFEEALECCRRVYEMEARP
jgi:glucose-6-phosphate dehydrogenase assembly protein OpcA